MLLLTIFSITICSSYGWAWPWGASPDWNGLKVTWGLNPFKSFVKQPRTVDEAREWGYQKINDAFGPWKAQRFVKGDDHSIILLYDINGYIAGIQTSIPQNLASGYPPKQQQSLFVREGERQTITAYFVDPETIATGRTEEDFESDGTGTNLYIQLSANPQDVMQIPKLESGLSGTKWTEGQCFYSMGKHYWYNLRVDMSCDEFFPVFLLYDGGKLEGFGWAMEADLASPRYEHPRSSMFKMFMKEPPRCLYDAEMLSTMHIFMTGKPMFNGC